MSMDQPNEFEQVLEEYAAAVRREKAADSALTAATVEHKDAQMDRQMKWGTIRAAINKGQIKPGIYRLKKGDGLYADGVLIEAHHDYPEIFPMFR